MNVKETKEMIIAFGEVAYMAGQVAKDSKINLSDAQYLPALIAKYPLLMEGVKDIDKVFAEIKDIDQAEMIELMTLMYSALNRFKMGKIS